MYITIAPGLNGENLGGQLSHGPAPPLPRVVAPIRRAKVNQALVCDGTAVRRAVRAMESRSPASSARRRLASRGKHVLHAP